MELTKTHDYQNLLEPKGATLPHLLSWSHIDLMELSLREVENV